MASRRRPALPRAPARPEVPARRRAEKRELITLLAALPPGGELTREEVAMRTGLDLSRPGDQNLSYNAREHCRDKLGFVVDYRRGVFSRLSGQDVVRGSLPYRRERILRQCQRGIAESETVDYASLSNVDQLSLLAHQAIMGTLALVADRQVPARLGRFLAADPQAAADPNELIAIAQNRSRLRRKPRRDGQGPG
jgi:hypothetical protein